MAQKKNHYIPRTALRRFSIDGNEKAVWVFDKKRRCSYPSPVNDAGAENYFYAFEVKNRRVIFEDLFKEIDDLAPEVFDLIADSRSLAGLNDDDREILAGVTAVQLLRTKMPRTTMQKLPEQLRAEIEGFGYDGSHIPSISENDSRKLHLEQIVRTAPGLLDSLAEKDRILISSEASGTNFMIGDNPVVLHNSQPFGEIGFAAQGIEIYLPISKHLTLGFYCTSLRVQFEFLEKAGCDTFASELEGIRSGTAVAWPQERAAYLQELQVQNATRFLYAATDEFELVEKMLDWKPELAEVTSSLSTGWKDRFADQEMPPGDWLVVSGKTQPWLVPIYGVETQSEPPWETRFQTEEYPLMRATMGDTPFKRIVVVEDGLRHELYQVEIVRRGDHYCVRML